MQARVFATRRYEREAKRLLSTAEIANMENAIAADPESHPVIPGTGGVRKARWARAGRGKSGGVRVIYYYFVRDGEVYMLAVYAKGDQADLSATEKVGVRKFVEALSHAKSEN
ncbi:MAG: type II toxin-antitoxin system RelE/ParE family toxin [Candidatus Solibacter sp.]